MKTLVEVARGFRAGDGVFSSVRVAGVDFGVAVERWDKRIPPGLYRLDPRHHSPRFGDRCIAVTDVADREHILFHAANRPVELLGCIAPGQRFSVIGGELAVANSMSTLEALLAVVRDALSDSCWLQMTAPDHLS